MRNCTCGLIVGQCSCGEPLPPIMSDRKLMNLTSYLNCKLGDRVYKKKGYKWPGVIVSIFKTLAGETRIVVECTVPEVSGALHVYNPEQLELMQEESCPPA